MKWKKEYSDQRDDIDRSNIFQVSESRNKNQKDINDSKKEETSAWTRKKTKQNNNQDTNQAQERQTRRKTETKKQDQRLQHGH